MERTNSIQLTQYEASAANIVKLRVKILFIQKTHKHKKRIFNGLLWNPLFKINKNHSLIGNHEDDQYCFHEIHTTDVWEVGGSSVMFV